MKKRYFLMITIVIIIAIGFLIDKYYVFKINNMKYSNASEYFDFNLYDSDLISKEELYKIADYSYYENSIYSGFNSYAIKSQQSDLYYIGWYSKLIEEIGFELTEEQRNNILLSSINVLHEDNNINIHYLDLLLSTNKVLNNNINKDKITDVIMAHYSESDKLFYDNSINDSLNDKINITFYLLSIAKDYNIELPIYSSIENKIIDLFLDENNFCINDTNIINCGGNIINILNMMGYSHQNFEINYQNWINIWNKKIEEMNTSDYFSIISHFNLLEINKFFGINSNEITKNFLNNLFVQYDSVKEIGYGKLSFINDPQEVYLLISLCNDSNYSFPFLSEINQIISEQINTKFYKNTLIKLNIIENYYGLRIAKFANYPFDKDKASKQILEWRNTFLGNPKISNYYDILNLYFILLSTFELDTNNLENSQKTIIQESITNYLNNINYNNLEKVAENLIGIQFSLEVSKLLGLKLPITNLNKIFSYMKDLKNNDIINKSSYISEYVLILKYLGKGDYISQKKISSNLKNLEVDGAYKMNCLTSESIPADLISTYKIHRIKHIQTNDKLRTFVYGLRNDKYFFVSSNYSDDTDLRIIYNALKLSTKYK